MNPIVFGEFVVELDAQVWLIELYTGLCSRLHVAFHCTLHRIACCIALMLLLFASIKWPIDHHLKRSLTKNSILNALRPPHIKIHTNGQLDLLNSCLRMRQSFQRQEKYFNLVLKMVEKSMIDAEKRNSETDALLRRQIIAKIWAFITSQIYLNPERLLSVVSFVRTDDHSNWSLLTTTTTWLCYWYFQCTLISVRAIHPTVFWGPQMDIMLGLLTTWRL